MSEESLFVKEMVADTLHGTIFTSSLEKRIMGTINFNRLHNISQNSTAFLTFPSNRTSRFEHSLGTMKLCGDIFKHSIANAEKSTELAFLRKMTNELSNAIEKSLIFSQKREENLASHLNDLSEVYRHDKDKLVSLLELEITETFYMTQVPANVYATTNVELGKDTSEEEQRKIAKENVNAYMIVYQAIRLAALLHDVGHPPFSHVVEYAMKDILFEIEDKFSVGIDQFDCDNLDEADKQVVEKYIQLSDKKSEHVGQLEQFMETEFEQYCHREDKGKILKLININEKEYVFREILRKKQLNDGTKRDIHEALGIEIATIIFRDVIEQIEPVDKNTKAFYLLSMAVACMILKDGLGKKIYEDLHSIISGDLDGDRLDYVSRDFINSGISIGKIEYDRLISSMALIKPKESKVPKERFLFVPYIKTINTVDDFFSKRFRLYSDVIFHHRVVKTDYLLSRTIKTIAREFFDDETSEVKESKKSPVLRDSIDELWLVLQYNTSIGAHPYSQWDENWMWNLLKNYYFTKVINDEKSQELEEPQLATLSIALEELISNKKHYYSIVKKYSDFLTIDRVTSQYLTSLFNESSCRMKALFERYLACYKKALEEARSSGIGGKEESQYENQVLEQYPRKVAVETIMGYIKKFMLDNSSGNCADSVISYFFINVARGLTGVYDVSTSMFGVIKRIEEISPEGNLLCINKRIKEGVSETFQLFDKQGELVNYFQVSSTLSKLKQESTQVPSFFFYVKGTLLQEYFTDPAIIKNRIGETLAIIIFNFLEAFSEECEKDMRETLPLK